MSCIPFDFSNLFEFYKNKTAFVTSALISNLHVFEIEASNKKRFKQVTIFVNVVTEPTYTLNTNLRLSTKDLLKHFINTLFTIHL